MTLVTNLLLAALLFSGCADGRSQIRSEGSGSANIGTYYLVSLTPDQVPVDEKQTVVITLSPGSGYKWNDEYPASFSLKGPEALEFEKAEFAARKKELDISKEAARISVPLTVRSSGDQKIEVKGNFSVCNKTSCKIMRNEVFNIPLTGK